MMDSATTGIEPELSLVKYKKLVGGNTIKIVNPLVREALAHIESFDADELQDIEQYILKNNSIIGAPHFKRYQAAWADVFDTSFPEPISGRCISANAHVDMMAAVQRYISSAISKTCNLPNNATPEEIGSLYMRAWKSGVKSIAVYRDGCKSSQPLEAAKKEEKKEEMPKLDKLSVNEFLTPSELSRLPGRKDIPMRKKLPDECVSIRHKFTIGGHEGYLHVGLFEDGTPGELFISMSKEGSTVAGMMDAFGIVTSMALQYGVPLAALVDKFSHTKFEPSGITSSPDVRIASSVVDYILRWMESRFIHGSKLDVQAASTLGVPSAVQQTESTTKHIGEICTICGGMMVRTGKCNTCTNCGVTGGCG
jgi:ribonucleoside-diphosphate reductase alpha chain